jgi:hypothetical protein
MLSNRALRILRVISTSRLASDCWPAIIASGLRSLMLTAELSGAKGAASCAIVTVFTPNSDQDSTKINVRRFNDNYYLSLPIARCRFGSGIFLDLPFACFHLRAQFH